MAERKLKRNKLPSNTPHPVHKFDYKRKFLHQKTEKNLSFQEFILFFFRLSSALFGMLSFLYLAYRSCVCSHYENKTILTVFVFILQQHFNELLSIG